MAYITYSQYVEMYGTCPLTEQEVPIYASLASDLIDSVTQYRIAKGGLSALPAFVQTQIEKAAAAQVLYMFQNGLEATMTGQTAQGFTVGIVHVDGGTNGKTEAQMMISPAVAIFLEQTGLMERSIPCLDPSPSSYLGIW